MHLRPGNASRSLRLTSAAAPAPKLPQQGGWVGGAGVSGAGGFGGRRVLVGAGASWLGQQPCGACRKPLLAAFRQGHAPVSAHNELPALLLNFPTHNLPHLPPWRQLAAGIRPNRRAIRLPPLRALAQAVVVKSRGGRRCQLLLRLGAGPRCLALALCGPAAGALPQPAGRALALARLQVGRRRAAAAAAGPAGASSAPAADAAATRQAVNLCPRAGSARVCIGLRLPLGTAAAATAPACLLLLRCGIASCLLVADQLRCMKEGKGGGGLKWELAGAALRPAAGQAGIYVHAPSNL